jgi:hypothetical protein
MARNSGGSLVVLPEVTTNPNDTRGATAVSFVVERHLDIDVAEAWGMLTDWPGHADWIPMTRVEVDAADPARFTAWSGLGRLALEDRMRAVDATFDGTTGTCRVEKLGPVLHGEAEFSVRPGPNTGSSVVHWREEVTVPHLPRVFAPLAAAVGRVLFGKSLARMAKTARRRRP